MRDRSQILLEQLYASIIEKKADKCPECECEHEEGECTRDKEEKEETKD